MAKNSTDIDRETTTLTQSNVHGVNVGRDQKIFNLGVNVDNLDIILRLIFNDIILLKANEASKSIGVLASIQGKDANIDNRIKIIKILLDSFAALNITDENIDFLKCEMSSTNASIDNKCIAAATFIHHLIQSDRKEDALNVYKDSDTSNYYINSIYISNLIDEEGIDKVVRKLFKLPTCEKLMLAMGCGLSANEEQCELLIKEIETGQDSLDKSFAVFWLKRRLFILKFTETQYYLLTVNQKNWLYGLIVECEQAIKLKKYDVRYVINIFLPLFNYIDFNKFLLQACIGYADKIKLIGYELWLKLAFQSDEVSCTEQDLWIYRYRESEDKNFINEVISEIKAKSVWTNDEVSYLIRYGNFDDIDIQSIRVEGQSSDVSVLSKIRLLIQSGQFDENKILIDIQRIEDIKNITLEFILITCQELFQKGLFSLINNLLRRIVRENYNNLWCSPVVTIYAHSLFNAKQYKSFNFLINQVNSNNWNSSFYYMKALISFNNGKIDKSLKIINQAILQAPYTLEYWQFHCHLITNDLIDHNYHLFGLLPDDFFQKPCLEIIHILDAMSKVGRTSQVEEILCEFFIKSPQDSSILLTQFYLGTIPKGINFVPSLTVKNVLKAIKYSNYDKVYEKLIIDSDDVSVNTEYALSKDTELARSLLSLETGEKITNHFGELTLLEEYPPLALAFQISSEIRQSINDGSDPFRSIPVDINDIEKSKTRISNIFNLHKNKEIVNDQKIPYFLKAKFLFDKAVVNSAFSLMQNEYTAGQLSIFDHGVISKEFVADVHSFVYLILTGLFKPLIEKNYKILVSEETKQLIYAWLSNIENNKDKEGGVGQINENDFNIVSNHDIYDITSNLRTNVKKLLNCTEVLSVLDVDLPSGLVKVTNQDYMDISLSSSLEVAAAHDKPILALDMLLAQYVTGLGVKLLNSSDLVSSLTKKMELEDKKNGLAYYAFYGLPFNVLFDDINKLLLEGGDDSYYLISNIIRKPKLQDSEYNFNFLKNILILTLDRLYLLSLVIRLQYKIETRAALICLINSVFCAVLNIDSQVKAEKRIAKLIYDSMNDKFILSSTRKLLIHSVFVFCKGHFLSMIDVVNEIKLLEEGLFKEIKQIEVGAINPFPTVR